MYCKDAFEHHFIFMEKLTLEQEGELKSQSPEMNGIKADMHMYLSFGKGSFPLTFCDEICLQMDPAARFQTSYV